MCPFREYMSMDSTIVSKQKKREREMDAAFSIIAVLPRALPALYFQKKTLYGHTSLWFHNKLYLFISKQNSYKVLYNKNTKC